MREHYDSPVQVQRLLELLEEVADRPASTQGRGRIRRRTFVAVGAGVAAVAVVAPYAALIPDDEFEQLVASNLGIDPKLAGQLLARARSEYGDAEYDARATAFALAVRDPAAMVLPDSAREKAISGLLDPMLASAGGEPRLRDHRHRPGQPGSLRRAGARIVKTVETDVAIVGSGVCGLLSAWPALLAGQRVTMLERGALKTHAEQLADGAVGCGRAGRRTKRRNGARHVRLTRGATSTASAGPRCTGTAPRRASPPPISGCARPTA